MSEDAQKELPGGWSVAPLKMLCSRIVDGSHNPPPKQPEGLPMLSAKNIDNGQIEYAGRLISPTAFALEDSRTRVAGGDVLLTIVGSIGRAAVVPAGAAPFTLQRSVAVLRPTALDPRFCMYQLQSPSIQRELEQSARGTAQKGVYLKTLGQLVVRVSPLPEQRRIVAKIEELFSDLDAGVAALERVRAKLKRYRASVLNAAVTGRLTEAWRQQNTSAESAEKLMARILNERRKRWETEQLRKFADAGKTPPKGWTEKYAQPVPVIDEDLPQLPAAWTWVALDAITAIAGGITKGQRHGADTQLRDVPYLRVANVQRGRLDLAEMKTIAATKADIDALRLLKGDILFNEGGDRDKLGRGWVWNDEIEECIHQNHVFRARVLLSDLEPKFISHHGNSFGRQWFQRTGKQSVNLASINMGVLRRFPVPLPPTAEQQEIVAEVERRLSVVDAVEAEVEHGLKRAARLRQAILKRAFEGKLLPQDPADKPASSLLARLAAEREGDSASKPKNRTKRSRTREAKGATHE